jgi:hypothetical protein
MFQSTKKKNTPANKQTKQNDEVMRTDRLITAHIFKNKLFFHHILKGKQRETGKKIALNFLNHV